MIQMYSMCVVWGEPLSQTAQSFMPELMYGVDRSLSKVSDIHFLLVLQPLCSTYQSYYRQLFPCNLQKFLYALLGVYGLCRLILSIF